MFCSEKSESRRRRIGGTAKEVDFRGQGIDRTAAGKTRERVS